MTRVLVLSPEPVRSRMAGMGVRALQVAATLQRAGHDVTLAAPGGVSLTTAWGSAGAAPPDTAGACDMAAPEFAGAARRAEVAVASGHTGERLYEAGFDGALVADLYDPFLVENLAYAESLGPRVFENDRKALFLLLSRADLALAATEEQRLFYLGLLLGRGGLHPRLLEDDPELRRVVDVAPFGVDPTPPGEPRPHPSLGPSPHDVLFGGVYDWYDPGLALDAWPEVRRLVPAARLVFSASPNPETTPQARLEAVVARAREMGLFGRGVEVVPWVPFDERGGFYRSFRAAVLTHAASLEAALSFRTRALDFLWAGLPMVATSGGGAARLLERSGAGLTVSACSGELAGALVSLLTDDALHASCAECAREAARDFAWDRTLAPLLAFVARPWRRRRAPGTGARILAGVGRRLGRKGAVPGLRR